MDGEEATLDLGVEQESVDGGETQEPVEQEAAGGEEVQQQTTQTPHEPVQVDPRGVRQALKAASEAAPEQAATLKELGNSYFREQAYKAQFATVEEAQGAKNLLEAIGGVDGAAQLQTRVQEYDTQETGLQNGDPAVLDSFFEDYPKQAVALVPAYLDRVAQQNPQALQDAVGPYAMQIIENSGIAQSVDWALRETDPDRKNQTLQQISEYLKNQIGAAKQSLQSHPKAGGEQPLSKERDEIAKERQSVFYEGVRMHTDALSLPIVNGEVDRYAKQYGLNDDQKKLLWDTLTKKVTTSMDGDKTYMKQVDMRIAAKGRTAESVAQYISSEFNRRTKAEAFNVLKSLEPVFGTLKAGKKVTTGQVKAGGAKTAPSGGPLYVSARPADEDIDWSKPDAAMDLIRGRAFLKSGKFVTWRKTAAA